MIRQDELKGIIFDYGGTLDTNGKHWAEVLWAEYKRQGVPVSKEDFREAYVHGERTLARIPMIKPHHNFYDVLYIKVGLQIDFLKSEKKVNIPEEISVRYPEAIAKACYNFVLNVLNCSRKVLEQLSLQYKLVLVSNFYGNIHAILKDFGLLRFFKDVIESSVVGVRKPDPAIFLLGVEALGCEAKEIVVIGDSFSKDMVPARKAGCKVVWLKGEGWAEETDESLPDAIISDLEELPALLLKEG